MKNLHISLLPPLLCLIAALFLLNLNGTPKDKPENEKKEQPYSFTHKVKKQRKVPVIESGVTEQMLKEHLEKEAENAWQVPLRISAKHNVNEVGLWEQLPDGGRLWRLGICSENAKGVGFTLHNFVVPKGAKLFAYNKKKDFVVGPIVKTNSPVRESRVRSNPVEVRSILGEEIFLEYYEPPMKKGETNFHLIQIYHRWSDFPYSMTHKLQTEAGVEIAPITQKDYEEFMKRKQLLAEKRIVIEGINKVVDYNLSNSGIWEELPNGDRVWRLIIKTPDFGVDSHLNPYFEDMLIPPGAKLFIYDSNKVAVYDAMVKRNHYGLHVPGNTMNIEYYEPKTMKGKGKLFIRYAKKYLWGTNNAKSLDCTNAYQCTAQVNCGCIHGTPFNPSDAYVNDPYIPDSDEVTCSNLINQNLLNTLRNSVVRIELIAPDGSPYGFCSGTLIANKNQKLYVLTANHCLRNPSDWDNWHYGVEGEAGENILKWKFRFYYEYLREPNNTCVSNLADWAEVTGGKVIATSGRTSPGTADNDWGGSGDVAGSDFALIELNTLPENVGDLHFAGWNNAQSLDDVLAGCGIHHPGGDAKKVSIHDDDRFNIPLPPDGILGVCDENNGIKPYVYATTNEIFQKDITENNNGESFAVTFERGITRPGSSGSAFFDETGKIRGQLRGGPTYSCCATKDELGFEHEATSGDYLDESCNPTANIANAKKYRNGNTERLTEYGRLWYPYNQVSPSALPVLDDERRTLQSWLDPDNDSGGMMEGVDVTDCDIYMRDGYCDTGGEPNFNCDMGGWDDIWASPDLWNTSSHGSPENEEINPIDFNFMGYRIHNGDACTSAPALLRLYWTMASTGEMWTDDWEDDYVLDPFGTILCAHGDEMVNSPVEIPAISPGGIHEGWVDWFPPNYTHPSEPGYYNPESCEINPDVENGRFEVCLLARIMSLDNPIRNEAEGPIAENVLASNNIVTRNTFLIEALPGEPPKPHCILVTNNNSEAHNLNVTFEQVARELDLDYNANTVIELLPSITLWDAWQSTGAKSEGLQITGNRVVEVTDFTSAKLLDIPFDPKEQKPMCIKVYDTSGGSSSGKTEADAAQLTFKIAHEPANPNDHINASSACVFKVSRKSAVSPIQSLQMRAYPNPFSAQTHLVFSLPNEAAVHLNIYDLKGALVQTLAAGQTLPEGEHTLLWNAQSFPDGVYIAILQTPFAELSTKIVKTK